MQRPDNGTTEAVFRSWVASPQMSILSGCAEAGFALDFHPEKPWVVSAIRRGAAREVAFISGGHRLLVNFQRLSKVRYMVMPDPQIESRLLFDIRFFPSGTDPLREPAVGIRVSDPYEAGKLCPDRIAPYFVRAASDGAQYPHTVSCVFVDHIVPSDSPWSELRSALGMLRINPFPSIGEMRVRHALLSPSL